MDIGVPTRLIGRVDVSHLSEKVSKLTIEDWEARPVRRASLAGAAHNSARSIVLKHEWMPYASKRGYKTIQDSLRYWCNVKDHPVDEMLPISFRKSSETEVYTFKDWINWHEDLTEILRQISTIISPNKEAVINRVAFVRLDGKGVIPYHIDQQPLAKKSHRIHIALSHSPGCIYKIGGYQFVMQKGGVYDFNNLWRHGVENRDLTPRINLMLEVLPNAVWLNDDIFY